MRENRRDERYPISVEVEVMIPGFWKKRRQMLRTRDMSNSGVFLESGNQPCPPVGAELEVRISGPVGGEAPPVVRARVVRVSGDGMAVVFIRA
ncbi:MAG TPA: PilZ domain-containing protein [Acidiferrobacterales bacterium]|nr:PilZ domain-containing protein [Acidiferrobacterales bacterium]